MRLWSLHPKYLDSKGFVALWRESLLARKVLCGGTRGYRNHPQLDRFKNQRNAVASLNSCLTHIHKESVNRSFNFDEGKIGKEFQRNLIPVTKGQLEYEKRHLLAKLKIRDKAIYKEFKKIKTPIVHPLSVSVDGPIEDWEVVPT